MGLSQLVGHKPERTHHVGHPRVDVSRGLGADSAYEVERRHPPTRHATRVDQRRRGIVALHDRSRTIIGIAINMNVWTGLKLAEGATSGLAMRVMS